MNDVRNSLPWFIGQKPSVNLEIKYYLHALEDPFEISCFIHLDSKKKRNRLAQNGAESIPIGIPISCLKTKLPLVKMHF